MEHFPANLEVCQDDFRRSGWKAVLDTAGCDGYPSMWQALSEAARKAIEEEKFAEGKSLWLLADACSMMLNHASVNEPFKPFIVINGKRSAMPEDFKEEDVSLLSGVVEEIDDVWLRARIADLVWLLRRPRDPKYALLAIDAYRAIPLDMESLRRGGLTCWERAISLAITLRTGAGDRLKEIETELICTIEKNGLENGVFALKLADLMALHRLGHDRQLDVAKKLEDLARKSEIDGSLLAAREYFEASSRWFQKSKNKTKVAELIACTAEILVKEAIARVSTEKPSYMAAASFLEDAIQKYRSIPKAQRPAFKVDERMAELHTELTLAGEKSLDEMGVLKIPGIDISEMVNTSVNSVRGKRVGDALFAFANMYKGFEVNRIRDLSMNSLSQFSFQSLFMATHISRDGRVIAKRPPLNANDSTEEENETLWAEMVKHYTGELGLIVQGCVWPALGVLRLEHRLREYDFIQVANLSPIVPPGRGRLIGKALFSGYDNDFVAALHLLVPQIEHMVRWHLKSRAVKTTNLDSNGIENENGLSTLVELQDTKNIFGEDLSFEIKALFCDSYGPNLRNELAHGLLDYDTCDSVYSIYAWWFCLRVVFNSYWNTRKHEGKDSDET